MAFTREEVKKRRIDDFETVVNCLRDLNELDVSPKKEIQKVLNFMYDLFEKDVD